MLGVAFSVAVVLFEYYHNSSPWSVWGVLMGDLVSCWDDQGVDGCQLGCQPISVKRRSGAWALRMYHISMTCLLSDRILRSMHESLPWGVFLCGCEGVLWVGGISVVGVVLHTKRKWVQANALSVWCGTVAAIGSAPCAE